MRVLLDDGIDEMLGDALTGHKCATVADEGLSGLDMDALRAQVQASGEWDAWVTFHSPDLGSHSRVLPNLLNLELEAEPGSDMGAYMPQVAIALETMQPGEIAIIGQDWLKKDSLRKLEN